VQSTADAALGAARYLTGPGLWLTALLACRDRRLLACTAVPALMDWMRSERTLDPARFAAIALADDAAYGTGVLWGARQERSLSALIPRLI
jgi:hypothetical protein